MQSKTTRRTFVKGLAATGIIGGLGLWRTPVWAVNSPGQPNVLTGNEFDLFIGETPVNITGAARTAMTINGSLLGRFFVGAKAIPSHCACATASRRTPPSIGTASSCRRTWMAFLA